MPADPFQSDHPPTQTTGYTPADQVRAQAPRKVGSYVLLEEIGRGANGVVFRAKHEALEREVALKVLLGCDAEGLARFQLEAKAMSRIVHPGVVSVFDIGVSRGHPYYVMELCEGETLRDLIARKRLGIGEAVSLVRGLAEAVAVAHEAGVIHRDLKPANVLLAKNTNQVRITDFGLARDERVQRMTRTGDVLGTPVYMAPEQAGGRKDLDGRIDVYALGVILYECLSGRPPYLEASWLAMRQAIMNGKPTPPSALRAEIPRGVEAVCLQAMAARREDRIQSAAALATALTDLEANLADRNADADADETHVERGQARRVSSRRSSAPEAADWRPSPLQIAGAAVFALALVGGTIGVMSLGADVASLEPISAAKVGESIVLQDSARAPAPTPLAETASRRAKANGAFTSALALARDAARSRKPTPEVLALLERADGLALNEEAMAEALAVRVALRFHRLEMRKVIGLVPPDTSSLTLLLLRSIAMGVDGKAAEAAPGLKRIAAEGGAMRNAAEAVRAYYAKDARRAEYEARRALEESPGLSSIRIVLAIVLLNGADGETLAGPEIEKILKDRPDDVMALHVDGKLLAVGGKFDEALERFKLARSLGTPLGMQNDYAEALLFKTTPRPRLAIEELTTFIDRAGNRPAACQPLVLRAIAWALEEEIDRGGADVKKAVELGGWAALRVAKIYRRRGLVDDDVLHRLRDAAGLGDWGRRNRGRRGRDGDRGRKRDYDRD